MYRDRNSTAKATPRDREFEAALARARSGDWSIGTEDVNDQPEKRRLSEVEKAFGQGAEMNIPEHEQIPADFVGTDAQLRQYREAKREEAGFIGNPDSGKYRRGF
jgi:hypothetical protein